LISPRDALDIVLGCVRPLRAERLPLAQAAGGFLAEAIRADRDMPPADRSAMDGYAVQAGDLAELPRTLRLTGEVAAGSGAKPRVRAGCCVRILTGANVPPGADTVVMQEDTAAGEGEVTFLSPVERGENIRRRGEECVKGDVLLEPPAPLGPLQVGLCAAVGKAIVKARPRPRVAVLVTGEEVRPAGDRVTTHQLRDSNGPALLAALREAGIDGATSRIVPDDPRVLARQLKKATERCDVVIVTGGVSVGSYDYGPEAIGSIGAKVHFHGVEMKPGRPQLFATVGRGRTIFGLPGNPLSVMTGYYEFVLPALRRLAGCDVASCQAALTVTLSAPARSKGDRAIYRLARLTWTQSGPVAAPIDSRGSADIAAGARADGMVIMPVGVKNLPAGATAEFRPWRALP